MLSHFRQTGRHAHASDRFRFSLGISVATCTLACSVLIGCKQTTVAEPAATTSSTQADAEYQSSSESSLTADSTEFASSVDESARPDHNELPVDTAIDTVPALEPPPDELAGETIEWEGWKFNWQYRKIEGLVLTNVHFQGRKVLKYIGLAEIYVPYATGWPRPLDFTLGGFHGNPFPIDRARDCYATSECQALNRDGKPATGPEADLMIHKENTGFAYAGVKGRAPGKMLVLWSMCHFPGTQDGINNDGYTYVIRWKLSNDGSLHAEVGATGGLQHLNTGEEAERGVVVGSDQQGRDVFAPTHVHNFYFRVDLDIDGADGNVAQELNYVNDPADPLKSRVVWQAVDIERGRMSNEQTFRSWRIMNPKSLNAQGHPRSYHILKSADGAWRDGSDVNFHWIVRPDILFTRYYADEFPYSSVNPTPTLTAIQDEYMTDEPLQAEDIVAWVRVGFLHHPRSEDWSVQPIVWRGFELMPRDFLDGSPLTAK